MSKELFKDLDNRVDLSVKLRAYRLLENRLFPHCQRSLDFVNRNRQLILSSFSVFIFMRSLSAFERNGSHMCTINNILYYMQYWSKRWLETEQYHQCHIVFTKNIASIKSNFLSFCKNMHILERRKTRKDAYVYKKIA